MVAGGGGGRGGNRKEGTQLVPSDCHIFKCVSFRKSEELRIVSSIQAKHLLPYTPVPTYVKLK